MRTPHVLVLGATGMLGRVVYTSLKGRLNTVWGTSRQHDKFFYLDAQASEKWLTRIERKVGKIDYVVNCIGLLQSYHPKGREPDREEFLSVNTWLPLRLEALASSLDFNLLHVSTNAVLPMKGKVDELTKPQPETVYGMTKFLGEPVSHNCLTLRSSFIGLDPVEKKGLMELVLQGGKIQGFTNQKFSGCTTLQFARFVLDIITQQRFSTLRRLSSVLHFNPIQTMSKFRLLTAINKAIDGKATIIPAESALSSRQLFVTRFDKQLKLSQYREPLSQAFKEVLEFEQRIKHEN